MHSFLWCVLFSASGEYAIVSLSSGMKKKKKKKKAPQNSQNLSVHAKVFHASVEMKRNFCVVEIGADHCLCVSC